MSSVSRSRLVAIIVVFALFMALVGCGPSSQAKPPSQGSSAGPATPGEGAPAKGAPDEVIVGAILPLTGPWAFQGQISREGLELAAEEINGAGGIKALGGAKLKLIVLDSGSTPQTATSAAQRLLSQHRGKLSAVIGAWSSGLTLAATEVTERAGIPWLTNSWSDQITQRGFKYVFRVVPNGTQVGTSTLDQLLKLAEAQGRALKKVAFVFDDTPASNSFAKPLKEGVRQRGIEIVLEETWAPPLADATQIVQKVKNASPDLLFTAYTSGTDGTLLMKKLKELGVKVPMLQMGGAALTPNFKELVGDLTEGLLTTSDIAVLKGQEKYEQMYVQKYGHPFFPKDALTHYGALWVVKEALEQAGTTDAAKVRESLLKLDVTSGPASLFFGRTKFKESGDFASVNTVIVQWQGNKPVTVWPKEWAVSDPIWPK